MVPAACGLILLAAVMFFFGGEKESESVSSVRRSIQNVVLTQPNGGLLGPWWISAGDYDPLTGEFAGMRIECPPMLIGAGRARLIVDSDTDSFKFEMWDVLVVRLADEKEGPDAASGIPGDDSYLVNFDHYVLGPIPYGVNIVPDGGERTLRPLDASAAAHVNTDSIDP